jgi:hypothetical protein
MTLIRRLTTWLEQRIDEAEHLPSERVLRAHFGSRNLLIGGREAEICRVEMSGLWPATQPHDDIRLTILPSRTLHDVPDCRGLRRGPYGCIIADDVSGGVRPAAELAPWLVCFEPERQFLLAYDPTRGFALLVAGASVAPREHAEFCRPLLHWAAINDGHVLVHAAAIARGDRGLLVTGAGRAGKTTLVRACLAAGFEYLGDNVVELDGTAAGLGVWGAYPTLKVRPGGPGFIGRPTDTVAWDEDAHKEIHFLGGPEGRGFRPSVATHAATLVLTEQGPAELVPLAPPMAFFATAPNTIAQFPFFHATAFARLKLVSERTATYTAGRLPLDRIAEHVERLVA